MKPEHGDVGDVGDPKPVGAARAHVLGKVGEDRTVVIAVRRRHEASARAHGEPVFLHDPHHLLVVDDAAFGVQFGGDATIAVGWPLGADLCDALDQARLIDCLWLRLLVERRSGGPHQSASFGDRETTGPAMTDVTALFGWAAER